MLKVSRFMLHGEFGPMEDSIRGLCSFEIEFLGGKDSGFTRCLWRLPSQLQESGVEVVGDAVYAESWVLRLRFLFSGAQQLLRLVLKGLNMRDPFGGEGCSCSLGSPSAWTYRIHEIVLGARSGGFKTLCSFPLQAHVNSSHISGPLNISGISPKHFDPQ